MKKKEILKDHKRIGKKFIPPMKQLGIMQEVRWYEDTFPELLLLAVHNHKFGMKTTALDIEEIISTWLKVYKTDILPSTFLHISSFIGIPKNKRVSFLNAIKLDTKNRLFESADLILSIFQNCPIKTFFKIDTLDKKTSNNIEILREITIKSMDRTSRFAMEIQTHILYAFQLAGKIEYSTAVKPPKLNLIIDYPNTEESIKEAGRIRASIKIFCTYEYELDSKWTNYYWKRVFSISNCELEPSINKYKEKQNINIQDGILTNQDKIIIFYKVKDKMYSYFENDLKRIRKTWSGELNKAYKFEVCSALFSRISLLVLDTISNVPFLMLPYPYILLRSISESFILLTWLLEKGKPEDFKIFIEFGLGQEKLYIEHLKSIDDPTDTDLSYAIKMRERWLSTNKYDFLIPVDVSNNPYGKSVRQMAIEIGRKDLFNFEYSFYSTYVHGHWNNVSRINMSPCFNPLHGLHLVPSFPPKALEFALIDELFNYYEDSYNLISENLLTRRVTSKVKDKYWQFVKNELKKMHVSKK